MLTQQINPKIIPKKQDIVDDRAKFVAFASWIPPPSILLPDRNKDAEKLTATSPQPVAGIPRIGESLESARDLVLDETFMLGVLNISIEYRSYSAVVGRITRNQPKSVKKAKNEAGMSRGELFSITKSMIKIHVNEDGL